VTDRPGSLEGRTALVTGGNGGIGLGMASAMGREGAQIVIWGRNEAKNAAALQRLQGEGTIAHALVCDVADGDAIAECWAQSVALAGGRIDAVFANAGTHAAGKAFHELSLDAWRRVMNVNLDSIVLLFQHSIRHMLDNGGGSLVAVSSTSAIHGPERNEAYAASKTALLGLVRALAVGYARNGIRVNALVPGWTRTELSEPAYNWEVFRKATTQRTPVRRWADPDEMGPAAVFLADPAQTFHTGQTLIVDGGYTVF
jgi:NAD(P)-dependent dehydrogenase (short-subunit alcohol dehydrogenase family)